MEEYYVLTGAKPTSSEVENESIFKPIERKFLEETLTDREIDELIYDKERDLLLVYQSVLANPDLPGTTNAILQSQAEELNSLTQGLLLDYRIAYDAEPIYRRSIGTGQVL